MKYAAPRAATPAIPQSAKFDVDDCDESGIVLG